MSRPDCAIRGCPEPRGDGAAYCAAHLERMRTEPHWVPCHLRDDRVLCALCGTEVVPARRDDGLVAALERSDEGRVQLVDGRRFLVLDPDGVSLIRHAGGDLYRSHGPACTGRPV